VPIVIAAFGLASCGGPSKKAEVRLALNKVAVEKTEPTRIVVVWETSVPTDGEVRYGTSRENLDMRLPVTAMTTLHRTTIEGLTPNTTYFYQVHAHSASDEQVAGSIYEAATPSMAEAVASGTDGGYDVAVISTSLGEIVIRFLEADAPKHVENFKKLTREGFYDGTTFHRVVPGFVIQGGDPLSKDNDRSNDGTGGPGYTIPAEIHARHVRGSVAAARTGDQVNPRRRSSGSQFYICVAPLPNLDGQYTVFGHVVRGMDVVDRIVAAPRDERDNPRTPIPMRSVTIRHIAPGQEP